MIGVSQGALVIFCSQLASMLRSRLPLYQALANLAAETRDPYLRRATEDVVRRLGNGEDFAEALALHPRVFGPVFVSTARSGMESGRLAEAVTGAAQYLEQVHKIQSRLGAALVYPMMLVAGFVVIFHALVFFVLPRFQHIFDEFNKTLPVPTQILLGLGKTYADNWPLLAAVVVAAFVTLAFGFRRAAMRRFWDRWKLKLPFMGPIWRLSALARFAHTMSLQIDNSVSLVRALRVSAPAARNLYYGLLIERAADDIEMGYGVAQSLGSRKLFSGAVQQMAVAGEQTGRLDEMFSSVAGYFDTLWLERMDGIAGILNPILTAVIGGIIAAMMIAAFLPIFSISGVTLN